MKEMSTADRIRELVQQYGTNFYVSFSGGKDSEVAVDYTARLLKQWGISRMYVLNINTGLEYLSVHKFCKPFCEYISMKYDIEIILDIAYPEMIYADVIKTYGYPLISKEVSQCIYEARKGLKNDDGTYQYRIDKLNGTHLDKNGNLSQYNCPQYKFLLDSQIPISHICCIKMKKEPAYLYEEETGRVPLIATTCEESRNRTTAWLEHGCNAFNSDRPKSAPFSTWTNNDMLTYIHRESLPMAEAYGKIAIVNKTGIEGQINMFDETGYDGCQYCTTGCPRTGCIYCLFGITQDPERILRLQELEPNRADYVLRGGKFNEEGYWVPTKDGLGYWYILDFLAENGIRIPYKNKEKYRHQ